MKDLDKLKGWSQQRQIISAALFLHQYKLDDLETAMRRLLNYKQEYDNMVCYDISIMVWRLTLTFKIEGDHATLHDIVGVRGEGDSPPIYTWKHIPIDILKHIMQTLGATVKDVRTR